MTGVGGSDRPRRRDQRDVETTDAGLTPIHEARLTEMAIRRGWLGQRWPTRETAEEFQARVSKHGMTLIDKAVLATNKLLVGSNGVQPNERAQGIAIRCVLVMESQNQADDHRDQMSGEEKGVIDGKPVGTMLTPDQVAMAMDATIPSEPEEETTDDQSGGEGDADAGVDADEVQRPPDPVLPVVSPVPSGGCGPEIW